MSKFPEHFAIRADVDTRQSPAAHSQAIGGALPSGSPFRQINK
jgi:hypothetical protein